MHGCKGLRQQQAASSGLFGKSTALGIPKGHMADGNPQTVFSW